MLPPQIVLDVTAFEAQTIPDPGQAFTFYGFRFEVLRRQRNKITAVRITPLKRTDNRQVASKA